MSLLNDQALWPGKFFNGQWQAASQSREAVEVGHRSSVGRYRLCRWPRYCRISSSRQSRPARLVAAALSRAAGGDGACGGYDGAASAEIIDWLVKESGSLPLKAGFEWRVSHQVMKRCIGLPASDQGVLLPTQNGKLSVARRLPLGVVGVISPFNFPLYLALRSVAPALALGNAVVLKPDERTAVCSGYVIARRFELAGLPAGLLHVFPGGAEAAKRSR